MKNYKELYRDIFDDQADSTLLQHTAEIEKIYSSMKTPEELNWARLQWSRRQQSLPLRQQRPPLFGWARPRLHPLPVLAALLLIFLLSSVAFALGKDAVVNFLFNSNNATQQLLGDNQFTALRQQWTVNGYKVSLEKAYADANNIILAVTADVPHGLRQQDITGPIADHITLRTRQGISIPFRTQEEVLDTTKPEDLRAGSVLYFDASDIQGNPARIGLHLEMEIGCSLSVSEGPCTHHTVKYDFSLLFHAGKVITPHQTIMANGLRLTLEKVVETPTETRFYLSGWSALPDQRFPATNQYDTNTYQITLSVGGQNYVLCTADTGTCTMAPFLQDNLRPSKNIKHIVAFGIGPVLGHGQNVIGLSLKKVPTNPHSNGTLTIERYVLHWVKNADNGGYDAQLPAVPDSKATPWVFNFKMP